MTWLFLLPLIPNASSLGHSPDLQCDTVWPTWTKNNLTIGIGRNRLTMAIYCYILLFQIRSQLWISYVMYLCYCCQYTVTKFCLQWNRCRQKLLKNLMRGWLHGPKVLRFRIHLKRVAGLGQLLVKDRYYMSTLSKCKFTMPMLWFVASFLFDNLVLLI